MFTNFQYHVLKRISPGAPDCCSGQAYEGRSKLAVLMGGKFFEQIRGKLVIDFGCGEGAEAIEMAQNGAARVIGVDIREELLQTATRQALAGGVADRCEFTHRAGGCGHHRLARFV